MAQRTGTLDGRLRFRWTAWRFLAVLVLLGGPASAGTVQHPAAGVSLWIPDTWKSQTQQNGVLTMMDPREEIALVFKVLPASSIPEAVQRLDAEVGRLVGQPRMQPPQEKTLNGMPAWVMDGQGVYQGRPVELSLLLLKSPTGQVLMCFAMAESARAQAHAPTLQKVLFSIQPSGSGGAPGARASSGASGGGGTVLYKAIPPKSSKFNAFHGVFTDRRMEGLGPIFGLALRLPRDLAILGQECGELNAFYTPSKHAIVLCYDLAPFFHAGFTKLGLPPDKAMENTFNAMIFVLLHELGHALIGELDMGVTGGEEDAVDDFAAVVLIAAKQQQVIRDGAMALLQLGSLSKEMPFWDEHSFGEQRFFNVLCTLYGADPEGNAPIAKILPGPRARRCADEFRKKYKAWDIMLTPHSRVN